MNPNLANVARIDEFISKSISLQACFMGADIFVGNSTRPCKISVKEVFVLSLFAKYNNFSIYIDIE